jgi:DNA-directed RNA polymerase specialized sigma24 family protein
MEAGLTVEAFAKLLEAFDADRQRAGEKYEDLRRTLIRFFEWRGAPFPEDHTDETFNRVARKLDEGVDVKNIGGYCYEVARLVCLEALKGPDTKRSPLGSINLQATAAATDEALEKERRLSCLEDCLRGLSRESRELIMEYYRDGSGRRIDHRKALAERLGLRRDALANRAQRVRDRLEQCVAACLKKSVAI